MVTTRILIVAIAVIGSWLLIGLLGVMSFGQAIFLAAGGYAAALASRRYGSMDLSLTLAVAPIAGAVVGACVGGLLLAGRRPPAPAIVAVASLTLSVIAERSLRGSFVLGGQNGLPSLPPLHAGHFDVSEPRASFWLALGVFLLVLVIVQLWAAGPGGLMMRALNNQEQRLNLLGANTGRMKWFAFIASGAIVALAGGMLAATDGFVGPAMAGPSQSTQLLLYVLLSGGRSLIASVVVTFVFEIAIVFLSEWMGSVWPIALGLAMVLIICVSSGGPWPLGGRLAALRARFSRVAVR